MNEEKTNKGRARIDALLILLFGLNVGLLLPACEKGAVIDLVTCVAGHDRLSIAFKDPARAKAYLKRLGQRLGSNEPEATKDAADLVAAVQGCIP